MLPRASLLITFKINGTVAKTFAAGVKLSRTNLLWYKYQTYGNINTRHFFCWHIVVLLVIFSSSTEVSKKKMKLSFSQISSGQSKEGWNGLPGHPSLANLSLGRAFLGNILYSIASLLRTSPRTISMMQSRNMNFWERIFEARRKFHHSFPMIYVPTPGIHE